MKEQAVTDKNRANKQKAKEILASKSSNNITWDYLDSSTKLADFGKSSVAEIATVSFKQEKEKPKKVAEPIAIEETKSKTKAPAFEEVKGKGGKKPQQPAAKKGKWDMSLKLKIIYEKLIEIKINQFYVRTIEKRLPQTTVVAVALKAISFGMSENFASSFLCFVPSCDLDFWPQP